METIDLAKICRQIALDMNSRDVVVLDVAKQTVVADYFVIASGTSERQLQSIADEIEFTVKKQGMRPKGVEGYQEGKWILLDYGWVVVHLYTDETRAYYELEEHWNDNNTVSFSETGEVIPKAN